MKPVVARMQVKTHMAVGRENGKTLPWGKGEISYFRGKDRITEKAPTRFWGHRACLTLRLDQDDGHHPTYTPSLVRFQALTGNSSLLLRKGTSMKKKTLRSRYKGKPKAEGKTNPKKKISV